ncbi:MAG TPA: adenylate/guanylate cyclase domain-containing protein [Anaerolineales bacterium]|nr:adenylate/guanylate cyclase domain-containing protein [Anaerolineales bacterium]
MTSSSVSPISTPRGSLPPLSPEGERRTVTILFCDVKGSTALAEQLDPEEWTEIMNGAFRYLIEAVNRYGGTVARLMGDAILALFGAPVAHEDDPERAVRAALDILADLQPYQQRVRERLARAGVRSVSTDYSVRVGINTGLVVVGEVGTQFAQEYTAMGDAVNVAARMEQTAEPGTIQVAHDTYRLVASLFEVEMLGEVQIKGKREPIRTYRVLGLKAEQSAAHVRLRGNGGMSAPLVGHTQELALLQQTFVDLHAGQGKIVCLVGDAGLGKSRLVQELKGEGIDSLGDLENHQPSALTTLSTTWYESASLSFETAQPYGAIQRLVRRVLGVVRNDPPARVREYLTALLKNFPDEQRPRLNRALEVLLGLTREDGQYRISGEDMKRELLAGMAQFWRVQAGRSPLVLVFEDLHWADSASVDLLTGLLPFAEDAPILFLCVFRPERDSPAWRLKQIAEQKFPHRYQEIALYPLSDEESERLARSLLALEELPVQVIDLIHKKAEGNPFFIEEIIRELIESEVVVRDKERKTWQFVQEVAEVEMPESLQSLLVARMDRLKENARHTLQLAAVLGRSFYGRVLKRMSENGEGMETHLRNLQQAGLVVQVAREPEQEFIFRHALTQEAAYQSILLKNRREYHRRAGQVMEGLFSSQLDDYAPVLAHHFYEAGDHAQAATYFARAAENSARLYAHTEAIIHYTRALQSGELGGLEEIDLFLLYRGCGMIQERLGNFPEARMNLETALRLARTAGDRRAEWQTLLDLGQLWASRDYEQAGEYFRRALALARQMEDPATLGYSLNRLGNWYANTEQPRQAVVHHQEALATFEELRDHHGLAESLDLLGMANMLGADFITAADYFERAVGLFRDLDDLRGLVSSLTSLGLLIPVFVAQVVTPGQTFEEAQQIHEEALKVAQEIGWRAGESFELWVSAQMYGTIGDYEQAFALAQASLEVAQEIEHHQWMVAANLTLGYLYLDVMAWEEAQPHLEQSLSMARSIHSSNWIMMASGALARMGVMMNRLEEGRKCLDAVLPEPKVVETMGQRTCWFARAELALALGEPEKTLEIAERLEIGAQKSAPNRTIPILNHLRGQALMAVKQYDQAEEILCAGMETARQTGECSLLWRMYASLGHVYRVLGQPDPAGEWSAEARERIHALAMTIPGEELRQTFLTRALAWVESP